MMPACTAGAAPRTAIPNPPPIIANILRISTTLSDRRLYALTKKNSFANFLTIIKPPNMLIQTR
jgi:hypothetical protein